MPDYTVFSIRILFSIVLFKEPLHYFFKYKLNHNTTVDYLYYVLSEILIFLNV